MSVIGGCEEVWSSIFWVQRRKKRIVVFGECFVVLLMLQGDGRDEDDVVTSRGDQHLEHRLNDELISNGTHQEGKCVSSE